MMGIGKAASNYLVFGYQHTFTSQRKILIFYIILQWKNYVGVYG